MSVPDLYGLVLAGGHSSRMQRDKAALNYHGSPQLQRAFEQLQAVTTRAFVSVRADQAEDPLRRGLPQIVDQIAAAGPIAGIHAAQQTHPEVAWLVLACDLPFLDADTLHALLRERDPKRVATAYRSAHDGLPEPLCAIYEPRSIAALRAHIAAGGTHGKPACPRKFLLQHAAKLVALPHAAALDNINTVAEYSAAMTTLQSATAKPAARTLQVRYYALLREQAGCSEESVTSSAASASELFAELRQRHAFTLPIEQLRVAINAEFSDWSRILADGDAVVFIPPVAGG